MLLKNKILLVVFTLLLQTLQAQIENRIIVGVDFGAALASDLGVLMAIEPKYNINGNNSIGLRLGVAFVLGRNIEESQNSQYTIEEGFTFHKVSSLVATFDRYLRKESSGIQPFLGGGIGYYMLSKLHQITIEDSSSGDLVSSTKIKDKIGILTRGGFELGKFRLGFEYNIIPKSKIQTTNVDIAGSVRDSYFGVSIGCIFGGGKKKVRRDYGFQG